MPANFIKVESIERLDELFDASHDHPVILFKHSVTCGISSGVYREVANVGLDVNIVVIQTHRDISNEIAARTGIRHESPQAIVLHRGEPKYHASHYDIEAGQIVETVQAAAQ